MTTTFSPEISLGNLRALRDQSLKDLRILKTPEGHLNAGIPRFERPFGRDALIAAFELLLFYPQIAKNTLFALAKLQGLKVDPKTEEEPGKILHELIEKDLKHLFNDGWYSNNRRMIYYGSIDSTPLWIILFYEYIKYTRDWDTFKKLWLFAKKALFWIDNFGDKDGDGFVEYQRQNPDGFGLRNQGWKDSEDSIRHKDGSLASPPIALVEVQGYVYQAKLYMARLFRLRFEKLGDLRDLFEAERLLYEAELLKQKFNDAFWMPEEEFYALALDGNKKQVKVISSNVGHLLFTGIIPKERAEKVTKRLFEEDMFTKWGIRTLSSKEKFFNPQNYHNGTVWPHDNWMIFAGLLRRGRIKEASLIARNITKAFISLECIPELFVVNDHIEIYNSACTIQAWASGAALSFLSFLNDSNHHHSRTNI